MAKWSPLLLLLAALLLQVRFSDVRAGARSVAPDPKFFASGIPVIDIRTPPEWRRTGLVPGSIPLTFFDPRGGYDLKEFLANLKQRNVDTSKPFALLCQVGSRSRMLAEFLSREFQFPVLDLPGGIDAASRLGVPLLPYQED